MQKYVELLEKNVQWLAIALGGAFVLFMAWTYVWNQPAQVVINGETLGPSEIDPYIVQHVAKPLEDKMLIDEKIKIDVPKPLSDFQDTMTWKNAPPLPAVADVWNAPAHDIKVNLPAAPGMPQLPQVVGPGQPAPGQPAPGKVVALPQLAAATPAEARVGRSVVLPPLPGGQAPPAPAPGQPAEGGVDKTWATQMFKINMADIEAAFKKASIPAEFADKTLFLQVEMEREELDSSGKAVPGTSQVIAPLPTWRAQPPPPFPADGPGREAQQTYIQWASASTPDILQPLFYTTVPGKGDQWTKPGQQVATAEVFDPSKYTGPVTVPPLTAEQRDAVLKYRQEQYKAREEEKKSKVHSAPRAPSGPRGPGGFPGAPPPPDDRGYAPAPPRPPSAPPYIPGMRPPPGGPPGAPPIFNEENPQPGYGGALPPGLPVAGTDYPNGEFDPAKWKDKTIETWAHDETVQPGKTYHYRIRYKLKNPIWGAWNVAQDPKLSDVFALVSAPSAWSSPVTIPQLVNFFVQSTKAPESETVRFEVFCWDQGQQHMETFTVGPGDQVGMKKGDVDYSTDWTVVDFREDLRQGDTQILLVNSKEGTVTVRSYKADRDDPLYRQLKEQVSQQKLAETAAAGTGTPPPR